LNVEQQSTYNRLNNNYTRIVVQQWTFKKPDIILTVHQHRPHNLHLKTITMDGKLPIQYTDNDFALTR